MIIQWKPGTRFNIDAEIAFYELERISEQYGTLRPESVEAAVSGAAGIC